jgi:hypothetical protein
MARRTLRWARSYGSRRWKQLAAAVLVFAVLVAGVNGEKDVEVGALG